jgi:hypothetical protein
MQPLNLYWLIIGCEVLFWVMLFLSLAARYLLRRETLSRVLLFSLPLIDLILLASTALDLKSGTPASFGHGLAAAYVGFTVAFGGIAVSWADQHFAHRFMGGAVPTKAPLNGWPGVRYELILWVRCLVAVAITLALITALIAFVNDDAITEELRDWSRIPFGTAVIWFIFGPLWNLLFHSWRREGDA